MKAANIDITHVMISFYTDFKLALTFFVKVKKFFFYIFIKFIRLTHDSY